jgi:hypothetical protein
LLSLLRESLSSGFLVEQVYAVEVWLIGLPSGISGDLSYLAKSLVNGNLTRKKLGDRNFSSKRLGDWIFMQIKVW